jgi:hypothetical protein
MLAALARLHLPTLVLTSFTVNDLRRHHSQGQFLPIKRTLTYEHGRWLMVGMGHLLQQLQSTVAFISIQQVQEPPV